ncbi:MAG TPA: hypothetical protein VEH28_07380 [Thermoplasmata archaeon]|nr:hypothetical protein [Thermoplasmata archaeon]
MITFGAGYAFAALTVTNSTETGGGNYVNTAALSWWSLSANPGAVGVVPSAVPASVNTTVANPTRLPAAGTNYMVNTGTAGHIAQLMKFTEAATAPGNTEVETSITVNTGTGTISVTIYIETQITPPGTAQTFVFYIDVGDASAATITINYAEQISQQCSAVGTCP